MPDNQQGFTVTNVFAGTAILFELFPIRNTDIIGKATAHFTSV